MDINEFAKSDEIPSLAVQDMEKTNVADGQTDVKTVNPNPSGARCAFNTTADRE